MKPLKIQATESTPAIDFMQHNDKATLVLSGRSTPLDVRKTYAAAQQWLDEYVLAPAAETQFDINLEYFNTASSKIILELIIKLEDLRDEGYSILINYPELDEDLEDLI